MNTESLTETNLDMKLLLKYYFGSGLMVKSSLNVQSKILLNKIIIIKLMNTESLRETNLDLYKL